MTQLYAWRRPAFLPEDEWLEHTYVTDYKPYNKYGAIYDVILHSANFWYCWGQFDITTASKILVGWPTNGVSANLNSVDCICVANAPGEHGTILIYGLDGACHQLANQVLYTASPRKSVKGVKGWEVSYFLYGVYGRNSAWGQLKNTCAPTMPAIRVKTSGEQYVMKVDALSKELEKQGVSHTMMDNRELDLFIDEQLGTDAEPQVRSILHKFRKETNIKRKQIYEELKASKISPKEFANRINKLHTSQFKQLAKSIDPKIYEKLFGTSPGKVVNLIDPRVASGLFKSVKQG